MPTPLCLRFLDRALTATRNHLGMDVAFISGFEGSLTIYRKGDGPGLEHVIRPGDIRSIRDAHCRRILDGGLPDPLAEDVWLSAHPVSIPINDADGETIGAFCFVGEAQGTELSERDLAFVRILAEVVGHQVAEEIRAHQRATARAEAVRRIMEDGAFSSVYQPIWDFQTMRATGLEALTRFRPAPYRPPDAWFADAAVAGLGVELELRVMAAAMEAVAALPPDVYLSFNASPATILSGRLGEVLAGVPPHRLLLELTEHAIIQNYDALFNALAPLRRSGVRIAIDDAGAGYSTLNHILQIAPERIKLDMSLTRSVDVDPARRALVSAMVLFARETQATLIAEGVETKAEFETLLSLGVTKGQGYLFGRPADLATILELIKVPPDGLA